MPRATCFKTRSSAAASAMTFPSAPRGSAHGDAKVYEMGAAEGYQTASATVRGGGQPGRGAAGGAPEPALRRGLHQVRSVRLRSRGGYGKRLAGSRSHPHPPTGQDRLLHGSRSGSESSPRAGASMSTTASSRRSIQTARTWRLGSARYGCRMRWRASILARRASGAGSMCSRRRSARTTRATGKCVVIISTSR